MLRTGVVALGLAVGFHPINPSFAADAQQRGGMYRVGVISPGAQPLGPLEAFRDGLRNLGYVEGQTIAIDWRFAGGRNDVLPQIAGALVEARVDVIVA